MTTLFSQVCDAAEKDEQVRKFGYYNVLMNKTRTKAVIVTNLNSRLFDAKTGQFKPAKSTDTLNVVARCQIAQANRL